VADKAGQYRAVGIDDELFGEAAGSMFATGSWIRVNGCTLTYGEEPTVRKSSMAVSAN
jgi:hypothetical protein